MERRSFIGAAIGAVLFPWQASEPTAIVGMINGQLVSIPAYDDGRPSPAVAHVPSSSSSSPSSFLAAG